MVLDGYTAAYLAALAPFIAVSAAFVTPLLSSLFRRPQRFAFVFSETVLLVNALFTTLVFYYVYRRDVFPVYMFAGFPPPLGIVYEVDYLGAFMGLLVGLVFPLVNIASYRYLDSVSKHNEWYYAIFLGLEAGLLGMAYTGDLFNLFVMLEVASIAAYGLTAYLRERGYPLSAAIKYGMIGAVGSTMYFIAVVLLYSGIGTVTMADAASKAMGLSLFATTGISTDYATAFTFFAALAVWAFMIESAVFPHHFWLPSAYSGMPPMAAAAMAAVAEGVGIYVIIRILYTVVGINRITWLLQLLILLGSLNIIVGGYLAATANELRRLIAYTTVLDMGYVVIGVGLGTAKGLESALYYIVGHAAVKPLLFIAAGGVEMVAGTTDMDAVSGAASAEPWIGASLVIGGLAVIGVPPMNMFFAKLRLFEAVFEQGLYPILIVMLLGSAFAFIGFSRLWYSTCCRRRKTGGQAAGRIGWDMKLALLVFLIATIVTSIFYPWINERIIAPTAAYIAGETGRTTYIQRAYELYKLIYRG